MEILNEQASFRTVKEERFDAVSTNFLTELDGWQHYETETVEREVPNGKTYTSIVLEPSYNVNKELLAEYEAKRQQNSYDKITILQYSDKMEKSSSPTLVAMDKKDIVSIYNKALKKAIFQSQQRKQSDV